MHTGTKILVASLGLVLFGTMGACTYEIATKERSSKLLPDGSIDYSRYRYWPSTATVKRNLNSIEGRQNATVFTILEAGKTLTLEAINPQYAEEARALMVELDCKTGDGKAVDTNERGVKVVFHNESEGQCLGPSPERK